MSRSTKSDSLEDHDFGGGGGGDLKFPVQYIYFIYLRPETVCKHDQDQHFGTETSI